MVVCDQRYVLLKKTTKKQESRYVCDN